MQLTRRLLRSDTSVDDKILGIVERLGQAHRSFLQDLATRYGLTPLQVQVISAAEVSDAWVKVQQKEARYRYVIDASTF